MLSILSNILRKAYFKNAIWMAASGETLQHPIKCLELQMKILK